MNSVSRRERLLRLPDQPGEPSIHWAGGFWFNHGRVFTGQFTDADGRQSLHVSEGMAGQAVTATALVALVTGLLITPATKSIDRRWVLMFFSVLQIVSSLLVAFAPTLHVLLLGTIVAGGRDWWVLGNVDRYGHASGSCG
jgi:MFS family permease